MLGAAMQAPLTGLVLMLELTSGEFGIMIPMVAAATVTATIVARDVEGTGSTPPSWSALRHGRLMSAGLSPTRGTARSREAMPGAGPGPGCSIAVRSPSGVVTGRMTCSARRTVSPSSSAVMAAGV